MKEDFTGRFYGMVENSIDGLYIIGDKSEIDSIVSGKTSKVDSTE